MNLKINNKSSLTSLVELIFRIYGLSYGIVSGPSLIYNGYYTTMR